MSPPFIFRIDEFKESPNTTSHADNNGHWMPSTDRGANVSVGGGVSGFWFFCDGQQIQPLSGGQLPQDASCYSVFSMSYGGGYGFWVLRGDATNPTAGETWRPLCFEHDAQNFSSYVTNAGSNQTLRCQRPDQRWPRMLLPDIYQTTPYPISSAYGGLKGDLAIFLALIAFSMDQNNLRQYLRSMFINGEWIVHGLQHGRTNQRGVVVYVYTCPSSGGSPQELRLFEDGVYGNYYN